MTRMVKCVKLEAETEGLESPPFPGEKGQYIYENISQKAWKQWLDIQTMLINEHRLTPFEAKAKAFLEQEREKFLFGEGVDLPEGFNRPDEPAE